MIFKMEMLLPIFVSDKLYPMNSTPLKLGLIYGGVSILYSAITYLMGVDVMASWWVSILCMLILLTLVIVLPLRHRKQAGGYITFKDAFILILTFCAIGSAMLTIFHILLYNVIDAGLAEKIKNIAIEKTISMSESYNFPQEKTDELIDKLELLPQSFAPIGLLKSYLLGIIMSSVLALVVAAFIKKEPPMFNNQLQDQASA